MKQNYNHFTSLSCDFISIFLHKISEHFISDEKLIQINLRLIQIEQCYPRYITVLTRGKCTEFSVSLCSRLS